MTSSSFGQAVKRREDPDFLSGEAKFTADISLPNMVHMAMLHSPLPHAIIRNISTEAARALPGVVDVITGADTAALFPLPVIMNPSGAAAKFPPHPWGIPAAQTVLAIDRVRYVGDVVAVVVAETRQQAYDALAAIAVHYEPLPHVLDARSALAEGAPQLHETVPGNLNQYVSYGDKAATLAAIEAAEVVVKQKLPFQRVMHQAIETRATIANYDVATEDYTLWTNSQIPHGNRFLLSQLVMGIPYNKLRVIAPHIGGGFGSKGYLYADTAITLFLAKRLGRPVKWVDSRTGLARSTVHARGQDLEGTLAGSRDGTITALYCTNYANLGAYPATNGPGAPTSLTGRSITGAYAIPQPFYEVYCAFSNTVLGGPIRGAGRTEGLYLIERLVDLFAAEIGMDPVAVRRQNFVQPDQFPYANGLGWVYDTGNYEAALDKALAMVGDLEPLRAEARQRGKRLGVGVSSYVAVTGVGPSPFMAKEIGLNGSTWGSAHLRVHPTGDVSLQIGSQPHGQGHVTAFSQIVAGELGVTLEQIEVLHSDTRGAIYAQGSYGSRSFSVEGGTIYLACQKVLKKAKTMAAYLFGVPEAEVVVEQGRFYTEAAPDQAKTIKDIALALWYAWDLPPGMEPGLEVITFFDPPDFSYPFGSHVAIVEVDEATGAVVVKRYIAVDDFGTIGNPLLVDGQTHGNLHLGISQALVEAVVYDAEGQIATDSFLSYAITRASELPLFETDRTVTPTPHSPMGAKGAGDVAVNGVPPAIVSAVCNAIGVRHLDMPLTPEKVWRALQSVSGQ